jgi:hypothetical protein
MDGHGSTWEGHGSTWEGHGFTFDMLHKEDSQHRSTFDALTKLTKPSSSCTGFGSSDRGIGFAGGITRAFQLLKRLNGSFMGMVFLGRSVAG